MSGNRNARPGRSRGRQVRKVTRRDYIDGQLSKETVLELEPEQVRRELAKAATSTHADVATLVVKAEEERRFSLGLSYPANKVDVAVAKDGFRDFAPPSVLEECAWRYMTKSRELGLYHEDGTEGHGTVVESYIYRGPDWTVAAPDGSQQVIKAGDWLLGVIWDEETWPLVKTGLINGFSPTGRAARRSPDPATLASVRS